MAQYLFNLNFFATRGSGNGGMYQGCASASILHLIAALQSQNWIFFYKSVSQKQNLHLSVVNCAQLGEKRTGPLCVQTLARFRVEATPGYV